MPLCSAAVSNTTSPCDFLVSQSVQNQKRPLHPTDFSLHRCFDFTCGCSSLGSLLVHFYLDLLHDFGHTQAFVSCRVESHTDVKLYIDFSQRCNTGLFIGQCVDSCKSNCPEDLNILFEFLLQYLF